MISGIPETQSPPWEVCKLSGRRAHVRCSQFCLTPPPRLAAGSPGVTEPPTPDRCSPSLPHTVLKTIQTCLPPESSDLCYRTERLGEEGR